MIHLKTYDEINEGWKTNAAISTILLALGTLTIYNVNKVRDKNISKQASVVDKNIKSIDYNADLKKILNDIDSIPSPRENSLHKGPIETDIWFFKNKFVNKINDTADYSSHFRGAKIDIWSDSRDELISESLEDLNFICLSYNYDDLSKIINAFKECYVICNERNISFGGNLGISKPPMGLSRKKYMGMGEYSSDSLDIQKQKIEILLFDLKNLAEKFSNENISDKKDTESMTKLLTILCCMALGIMIIILILAIATKMRNQNTEDFDPNNFRQND